jgi:hypothetical protein
LIFLFSKVAFAVWDGLPYNPGETNNPECLPSQTDCDVLPAVTTELDPVFSTWLTTTPPLYSYTESDPIFTAWNKSTGISITKSQISDFPAIPTTLAGLTDDATHRLVTDTEKNTWNGKQDALGFTPVSNTTTVNGHALSGNISVTATDVGLGNVPNLSFSGLNTSDETTSSIQTKLGTVSTSTSTSGYLTSTDWNIFNNKQPAGSYLTSFTELDPTFTSWLSSTPPLYSYIETDPIFIASQAHNITSTDITNLSNLSGTNTGDNAVNSLYSGLATSKQDALNGTGLVRMSGTSVSYDNSTYLTSSSLTGYLQNNIGIAGGTTLIGGTLASQNLTLSSTSNATKGKILFGTSAYDEVNNRLGLGLNNPVYPLDILTSGLETGINVKGNINSFLQNNIQNASNGTSASSDWIATADTGTNSTNYIDMGINSSTYNDAGYSVTGALDGYLYNLGGNLAIGTGTAGKVLNFFTGGTLLANKRMTLTDTGLGIGTSTPTNNLSFGYNATNTIGTEISPFGTAGGNLSLVAGNTGTTYVASWVAQNVLGGTKNWSSLSVNSSNNDVYATGYSNLDIYKQTAGTGNWVALNATGGTKNWFGVSVNSSNNDVYATVLNGDIYINKQLVQEVG